MKSVTSVELTDAVCIVVVGDIMARSASASDNHLLAFVLPRTNVLRGVNELALEGVLLNRF